VGARVPYFPSEVGIRIPCFSIASRKWELEHPVFHQKWELEHPVFHQKWELEHPVFEESGSQGTVFEESEREVGIRAPYFSSGSGSQGTLFDGSKTYVQGNQPLHGRETLTLIMALAISAAYFGS
jgi:hypothetical protein